MAELFTNIIGVCVDETNSLARPSLLITALRPAIITIITYLPGQVLIVNSNNSRTCFNHFICCLDCQRITFNLLRINYFLACYFRLVLAVTATTAAREYEHFNLLRAAVHRPLQRYRNAHSYEVRCAVYVIISVVELQRYVLSVPNERLA